MAFTYNPYPFVNIVIPDKRIIMICYLPISNIDYIIGLIQKITGLVYDPDSPESSPSEGRYELASPPKLEIDSTGESYYLYKSCIVNVYEYFPQKVGGCAVEISFSNIIL